MASGINLFLKGSEASDSIMNQVQPRSSKRSRSAEVHNLSEKVSLWNKFSYLLQKNILSLFLEWLSIILLTEEEK